MSANHLASESTRTKGENLTRARVISLLVLFLIALAVRLYGASTFGLGLDVPGQITVINFDEAESCRAHLGEFSYSPFIGVQTTWLASFFGADPPVAAPGHVFDRGRLATDPRALKRYQLAKKYCHSPVHLLVSRYYSATAGALTVLVIAGLCLVIWPARFDVALTAAFLVAFANLHVAHSRLGTVDVPQTFFVYLFLLVLALAIRKESLRLIMASVVLCLISVSVKYFAFSFFAYAAVFKTPNFRLRRSTWFLVGFGLVAGTAACSFLYWDEIVQGFMRVKWMVWGAEKTKFGTGYAHIGTWRRWIRNFVDLFSVHAVGLGVPATAFALWSLRHGRRIFQGNPTIWLVMTPIAGYALYMLTLAPVTYYRHYLPLIPLAAILAAHGLWQSRFSKKPVLVALFLLYPVLLTIDSEYNYTHDPRHELRPWYQEHRDELVIESHYVSGPTSHPHRRFFRMEQYLIYGSKYLEAADYLILSENWYDNAFPNELNGPIVWNPEWAIKTRAKHVVAYREILADRNEMLKLEKVLRLQHFMPEFLLHRWLYGTFQLFIGDLRIYSIVKPADRADS